MMLSAHDVTVLTPAGEKLQVIQLVRDQYSDRIAVYVDLPKAPEPVFDAKTDLSAECKNLLIALGMLTTLHPTMEISNDPIAMARAIVDYVNGVQYLREAGETR